MTEETEIHDLPQEIRELVFLGLPSRDLPNCRLVSSQWNNEISSNCKLMKRVWSKIQAEKCIEMVCPGNIDFIKAMVKWAPSPNPHGRTGYTPLHWAAAEGHLEICRIIMDTLEQKNPANAKG